MEKQKTIVPWFRRGDIGGMSYSITNNIVNYLIAVSYTHLLFVEDLENFEVKEVMTNGKMVAKDHKLTYDLQAPERLSLIHISAGACSHH